jgi:hypothetical protein
MAGPPPIFVKFNDKVAIYGDEFVFSDASSQAHNDEPLTGVKLRVGGRGEGVRYTVSLDPSKASRRLVIWRRTVHLTGVKSASLGQVTRSWCEFSVTTDPGGMGTSGG